MIASYCAMRRPKWSRHLIFAHVLMKWTLINERFPTSLPLPIDWRKLSGQSKSGTPV